MTKKIDVKIVIKSNPLIEEESFNEERETIISRRNIANQPQYDILPPFTTKRRIRTSVENEK